jgi:endoglucanase
MIRNSLRVVSVALIALTPLVAPAVADARTAAPPDKSLPSDTRFLVPPPDPGAVRQVVDLFRHHQINDALLIAKMATTPQAVWITKGTPAEARKAVHQAVVLADREHAVAVLVAYNIPGRDCANLSAGGATTEADYQAWIDGFAAGLGSHKAVVILEPDGIGLLPGSNCGGPTASYPYTDVERFAELNYAVGKLEAQPGALVYLDGTHSSWLNVHDISTRLIQAGVQSTQGFFLDVSNFQFTANQEQYGTWISKCIARITANAAADCPDQYWNGGPHPALIADLLGEWTGVALDRYGVWSDTSTTPTLNTSGENLRYADTTGTTHFVIDTSRNGLGPWHYPSSYASDAAALDWCNPPGRGLGARPTANAGTPLVDAYLWVKTPGQSDGTCNRNGTAVGSPDPEWGGIVDPAAGAWFPQQALQLAQLAEPPI